MNHSNPVQEAILYISENLTSELTLGVLAARAHISPYHFHRLFLLQTGEAPMEYVRRRRLCAASRDLPEKGASILEIALKYGFESQDGFCRAFTRYYGITPGEYRRLNFRNPSGNTGANKEEKDMMYDSGIYERLACSHEEKKEALAVFGRLLQLSEKARRQGLLSLEQDMDEVQPELFKKAVQLLTDGVEPRMLKEILLNYILCGSYSGKDFLVRILITEGILAIQEGTGPDLLFERLSALFGEAFISEIQAHFGLDRDSQEKRTQAFLEENLAKPVLSKETALLEGPFAKIDGRSLQRLLREIDPYTLSLAVSGSSGKILARVVKSLSKKPALLLIAGLEAGAGSAPAVPEIADAQKKLIEVMHLLRQQGDISL